MITSGKSIYFDRVGHIELDTGNGNFKSYRGLDFRFEVNKTAGGGVQNYANIGVLGLSRNTVNALSTYLNANSQVANPKMIKVYAGYQKSGEQLIFAGDMIWVRPSQPVDNWLNIQAQVAGWLRSSIVSATDEGQIPLSSLIEGVGKEFNMDVIYKLDKDDYYLKVNIGAFDCNGNFHDILARVNTISPYIRVQCEYNEYSKRYVLVVYGYDADNWTKGFRTFKLNRRSGLIGIPEFTYPSVKFRMLMNPYVHPMDFVNIESEMLPNAGGLFRILSIKYTGHFRGDPWYMDCVGVYSRSSDGRIIRPS